MEADPYMSNRGRMKLVPPRYGKIKALMTFVIGSLDDNQFIL
jgi:hypothetical protein